MDIVRQEHQSEEFLGFSFCLRLKTNEATDPEASSELDQSPNEGWVFPSKRTERGKHRKNMS